jgi:hypothetical protein
MKALDGATLASRIPAFKQHHHLLSGVLDPALCLEKFDLKPGLFLFIGGAAHFGLVGVDALLEELGNCGFVLADFCRVQPSRFFRSRHPPPPLQDANSRWQQPEDLLRRSRASAFRVNFAFGVCHSGPFPVKGVS